MLAVTGLNHSVYRGTEKEANAGLPVLKDLKGQNRTYSGLKEGLVSLAQTGTVLDVHSRGMKPSV